MTLGPTTTAQQVAAHRTMALRAEAKRPVLGVERVAVAFGGHPAQYTGEPCPPFEVRVLETVPTVAKRWALCPVCGRTCLDGTERETPCQKTDPASTPEPSSAG